MDPEILNLIQNEMYRINITHHANFPAWYAALPPHARKVFDIIIEEDASPDLIYLAQETPDEERPDYDLLGALAGGNPDPVVALSLTNVTLFEIMYEVENMIPGKNNPDE